MNLTVQRKERKNKAIFLTTNERTTTMTWKDSTTPISRLRSDTHNDITTKVVNHRTIMQKIPLPLNNDLHYDGENKQTRSNNESSSDESFSSFLPSSIGSNISKSFDWAIETSSVQSCRNPFECYCFPIHSPTARKRDKDHFYEVQHSMISDSNDENEEDGIEAIRPYVPFILPNYCEYCGSPSIQKCHEFDPQCRRPATFFPKEKPPFCQNA